MRELISHPPDASGGPILLYDHLNDTGCRAAGLLLRMKDHLKLAIPAEDIARAAFIAGCTHDSGKAKAQFQEYIRGGKAKDKDHAAISSVFAFIVASPVFGQKPQPTRLLPFICAYAVNRHHGLLCNPEEAFDEASIEHQIAIAKGKIDERVWDFEFRYDPLDFAIRFSDHRERFESITADDIADCFQKFGGLLRQKADERDAAESWPVDLYFALLLVVSALTEADVACVIRASEPRQTAWLDSESVREYASRQPRASDTFQKLRERAWREITEAPERWGESALRLTLPTGLGKTLMGLYLSAELQDKTSPQPVVYALPYLSIIEQATDVAREVFQKERTGVSVIQHHSLSFPEGRNEESQDLEEAADADGRVANKESPNFEKARFALEDWDADLVVTTFDQLFYSFLSNDRGFIKRFFRLPGSVLLLDEVQTIPPRLIPAVNVLLEKLREKLGTRLIYMTATHPPFLESAKSLVRDEEAYFVKLQRTRLHLCLDPVAFSEYVGGLPRWLLERKGKKVLIVANTIRCARDLFAHLSQLKEEEAEFRELKLFYLSGSVVPVERLRRIKEIRERTGSDPEAWVCVVSTQCVEAGVDLDMDEAIRDFAPWDSLLQICGRVNRFGKRPPADVWVYRWVDDASETGREFHSYIYDAIFTDATLFALQNRAIVEEGDYLEIQRSYVLELERRLSTEASRDILQAALAWRFDELAFQKLFRGQERAWKVSVFCVADRTAERLKDIATELWSSRNPQEALRQTVELCESSLFQPLEEFLRIKRNTIKQYAEDLKSLPERSLIFSLGRLLRPMFQAYTISLPIKRLDNLQVGKIAEGFPYLSQDEYRTLNAFDSKGLMRSELPEWII